MKAESWEFQPQKVEFLEHKSKPALKILPGAGSVILKSLDFTDGAIEFDFEPLDPRFATVYFRWQNAGENECFYLRTERAGNPTAVDAVQYAPNLAGINIWDMLGHFQGNASFQKQAWNHIKLVVSGAQMRAYVNSESQPTLAIPRLEGNVTNGRIAFEGEAIIANLVIKPNAVEGLSPLAGIDPTDNDPRYLRHWQLSQPAVIPKGIDFSYDLLPKPDAAWTPIEAERRGLINLTRKFGKSESRRIVWLKTTIKSASTQTRKLAFGFSDDVWALINGKLLYVDKNWYLHPIRKEPDGRCSIENTTINLPLNAGDNELLIGVANDFYGWGIVARIDSLAGITVEPDRINLLRGQRADTVRLLFDQAHGEQPPPGPMDAITKKLGLEIQTSAQPINAESLKGIRILYLRAPSKEFTAAETEAIVAYVKGGGSLLLRVQPRYV